MSVFKEICVSDTRAVGESGEGVQQEWDCGEGGDAEVVHAPFRAGSGGWSDLGREFGGAGGGELYGL